MEPAADGSWVAQRFQAKERNDACFLYSVVRLVAVSQQADCGGVQGRPVALEQEREGSASPPRARVARSESLGCGSRILTGCISSSESSRTSRPPAASSSELHKPTEERYVKSTSETNKDIVRAFVAAWNERDFAAFERLMGEGAVLIVSGQAVPCDPTGTRAIAEEWTTAFPDWRFELRALVAEGDLVAAHMPYEGTFERPIYGVPPTGKLAHVDEMVIFRIAAGRIVEAGEVYDEAGMWRQLGVSSPA
jgi:steroid delta-isomerase-like uncharacterized protein